MDNNERYSYEFTSYQTHEETPSQREMRNFKKSIYRLVAGVCVLALVLGIAGGGLLGYAMGGGFQSAVKDTSGTTKPLFPQFGGNSGANGDANIGQNSTNNGSSNANLNSSSSSKPIFVTSTANGQAMSVSDIYETYSDAVVSIYVETTVNSGYSYYGQQQTFTQQSAGSGVIISSDGYIATNHHVVDEATKIRVCLQNGTEYEATAIGSDEESDVALIKVDATNLVSIPIGNSDSLRVGDRACVIGNPLGKLSGTLTVGYISALNRKLTVDSSTGVTMNVIQTDAAVNPGNSGGALINEYGELVGIIFAKTSNTYVEGLGYAIPINEAISVINDLVEVGYVRGRPALGIDIVVISSPTYAMMYRVNYLGVYVSASKNPENGLVAGDLIVSIGGEEVGDYSTFVSAIKKLTVGDTVDVEVMRGSEMLKLKVPVIELQN